MTAARPLPAVVILAHHQPEQLHRILAALQPLPVFLHVDAKTPPETFASMTRDMPGDVRLLPRIPCGWASPALLEAELTGYRHALAETDAQHVALLSGACYPLRSTDFLISYLAGLEGRSLASTQRMPRPSWPPFGGFDRVLFPQRAVGTRRRITGLPRWWPRGIVPSGGSQSKVLARPHIERILSYLDAHPRTHRFLSTCWIPDEVAIPTLLQSPAVGIDWEHEHAGDDAPWYIDWAPRVPHPAVLVEKDFPALESAAHAADPALFCRKVGPESAALLDRIDAELRR